MKASRIRQAMACIAAASASTDSHLRVVFVAAASTLVNEAETEVAAVRKHVAALEAEIARVAANKGNE